MQLDSKEEKLQVYFLVKVNNHYLNNLEICIPSVVELIHTSVHRNKHLVLGNCL